jgi:hypothetical protein
MVHDVPDDILTRRRRAPAPTITAHAGQWVEHRGSGFVGTVVEVERRGVTLRDDSGLVRWFPFEDRGFLMIESGVIATLAAPPPPSDTAPRLTASGAISAPPQPARVARADRLLVEGTHDAELIEKIWGDELRPDGIVVEPMHGADNLVPQLRRRAPGPQARIGVLLDHLVPGSKESRIAEAVRSPWVAVEGHVFVDVWQAIRPHVLGLNQWPTVPRGEPWKEGICRALGQQDPAHLWRQMLGKVDTYRDLEPSLVGAVERLLDFLLDAPATE